MCSEGQLMQHSGLNPSQTMIFQVVPEICLAWVGQKIGTRFGLD